MALIVVGMADLKVCRSPGILTTLGLGSCVGVCVHDQKNKIAGMAHIMLPLAGGNTTQNRMKFADTAIVDLINEMGKIGAQRAGLIAKIAGGAHMFSGAGSDVLKVGERNVTTCVEILTRLRIPIRANETGGSYGRTIELSAESGMLKIKTIGYGEKIV